MLARPKLFRDPVHNIISLSMRDDVERVLMELIATRTFQRLRRIRQLGFAYLIYHGAEHSRFSHSLGVLHVAQRMFNSIYEDAGYDPVHDRLEVLCAALLHDIGHGPFSHAIERVTGIHHEFYTANLIQDPSSEIHQVLAKADPTLPNRLLPYFLKSHPLDPAKYALRDIVSSQLDADRQDYILRDGLHTGVRIGEYDFERIQTMFECHTSVDEKGRTSRRLAVSIRAREAVEGYLIARFHMFKQVYLHKAVRAAEKMLEATFARAAELYAQGHTFTMTPRPPMDRMLRGERLAPEDFIDIDDTDVWVLLKSWRHDKDTSLSTLARGLLDRDLYKTIDLDKDDPVIVARTIDRANEIAKQLGHDPRYAVLPDRAQDTPYRPYNPAHTRGSSHIPIMDRAGNIAPIEHHSDLIHLLGHDSYKVWRLCVPADVRAHME